MADRYRVILRTPRMVFLRGKDFPQDTIFFVSRTGGKLSEESEVPI